MKLFTGTEYLLIDIANQYGLDRLSWGERTSWTLDNRKDLDELQLTAKHKFLFAKALAALEAAEAGAVVNHSMGLDATASGLQCLAVLSGCEETANRVNLIGGRREDAYAFVAGEMDAQGYPCNRDKAKPPLMT